MDKTLTAEEILAKYINKGNGWQEASKTDIISAMEEYAAYKSLSATGDKFVYAPDEEIEKEAKHYSEGWGEDIAENDFKSGAKWMREKVLISPKRVSEEDWKQLDKWCLQNIIDAEASKKEEDDKGCKMFLSGVIAAFNDTRTKLSSLLGEKEGNDVAGGNLI